MAIDFRVKLAEYVDWSCKRFGAWLQQLYPRKVEKDAENFPVYANIDLSDLGPPGR